MRAAAATILLLAAGVLAGHALGDTVPVPTVPTVTVSTPVVTVPITVPTLPTTVPTLPPPPVATTAVKVPTSTTPPAAPLPKESSLVGSSEGPSSRGASGGSPARAGADSSGLGPTAPNVERFRPSRAWITTTG